MFRAVLKSGYISSEKDIPAKSIVVRAGFEKIMARETVC